ncbi:ankyrin repeat-containing protein ITN1-like [Silene latifolia]|uniref:ankyrin repeat-containing protein ITN1-like n=1 Tax=Silene latifolia TaxID=37657 RepID=UPI003D77D38B
MEYNIIHKNTNVSNNERDLEMGDLNQPPYPISKKYRNMMRHGKSLAESLSFNQISIRSSSDPDDVASPSTPKVIISNAGKALAVSTSAKSLCGSNSSKSLVVSGSSKSFSMSGSSKRMDQRRMYVKQVTGKHKDTELHLAADKGDIEAVMEILTEIDAQMTGTVIGVEFDAELADIRLAIINEVNELGETPLFRAAEKGYLEIVKALLPHMTSNGIFAKNQVGFNALHVAASQGHEAIVQVLLDYDPNLSKTVAQSNTTPLISAAIRGHVNVVNVLLLNDSSMLEISKSNGKNALHLSARQGHVEIVKALLNKDPQLTRKTDKKGQTALHMAVKGHSSQVVRLILRVDPSIVMLLDKFGNAALHVATRKKRVEIVNELLLIPHTNVNALTRDRKTALDIAEALPLSEEIVEIKDNLSQYGAMKASELNQPRDELRKTVTEIQKNVHSQLEQARRTNQNVNGIAKELKRLHREGINNATNSVTVVAVLFATVAFAAIFTVPGGDLNNGEAVIASTTAFKVFFIFNAVALFTSLSVVVVQITIVRGETKSARRVVEIINKLMWLASICTTVSFISSSYIVVGKRNRWAAIFVTVTGASTMAGVLGTMTYYVVKYKRIRKVKKKENSTRNNESHYSRHDADLLSDDLADNAIFAI